MAWAWDPGTANPRINASLEPERQPQHRPTASRTLGRPTPTRTGDQPRLTTVGSERALSVTQLQPPTPPASPSANHHHQTRLDDRPTLHSRRTAHISRHALETQSSPRHTRNPNLASSASSQLHPGCLHPRDSLSPNPPTPLPGRRQTRRIPHRIALLPHLK